MSNRTFQHENLGLLTVVLAAASALGALWATSARPVLAQVAPARDVVRDSPGPAVPDEVLEGLTIDLEAAELDESSGRLVQVCDNGYRLVLTLDPSLQAHLDETVRRYDEPAQALVALDPITGRVLAWVEDTSDQPPVDNPARSSAAYAASIFKIVTATALIEEANVDPHETICVSRADRSVETSDLTPNAAQDTTCVDMIEAMAGSINVYFARQLDTHLSEEQLADWLERFGFNQAIPFELDVPVSSASVPQDRLERARMAAGFRHANLSPLHGAMITAAIANGGQMMQPTLVEAVQDGTGHTIYTHEPRVWRRVMHSSTSRVMTEVLSQTTVSGTARRYFAQRQGWPDELQVAGKTGTLSNRSEEIPNPDPLLTYSWFVGFAPLEDPSIAVASLIWNGERWHIRGSHLASDAIYHYYLFGP